MALVTRGMGAPLRGRLSVPPKESSLHSGILISIPPIVLISTPPNRGKGISISLNVGHVIVLILAPDADVVVVLIRGQVVVEHELPFIEVSHNISWGSDSALVRGAYGGAQNLPMSEG